MWKSFSGGELGWVVFSWYHCRHGIPLCTKCQACGYVFSRLENMEWRCKFFCKLLIFIWKCFLDLWCVFIITVIFNIKVFLVFIKVFTSSDVVVIIYVTIPTDLCSRVHGKYDGILGHSLMLIYMLEGNSSLYRIKSEQVLTWDAIFRGAARDESFL